MMDERYDAYGRVMLDYLEGKRTHELAKIGCKTWFSEFEEWSERERKAMRFVSGRVLDIGCGAGRHAIYLHRQGHDVLAIDNLPLAVEVESRAFAGVAGLLWRHISAISGQETWLFWIQAFQIDFWRRVMPIRANR
ncbi:MAG: methyltransferase domain-containing protein [Planctomycetota bacterium]|nr:methyltransferase domain-containing protein [Planctomycetota bacterium]